MDKPWLPASVRHSESREIRYRFEISKQERKNIRKKKKILVSECAEKIRYLSAKESSRPGRWKNKTSMYLVGPMDASFFPSVQVIIICAGPQTGKSEAVHNCIAYAIDRDPGPVLIIYPKEKDTRKNIKNRIQKMITSSPQLCEYLTGVSDDMTSSSIELIHMFIRGGWSTSASSLASDPYRYLNFEEIDKYEFLESTSKETDSISLGEARNLTYKYNRKTWKVSTPTVESGPIWQALTTEAQIIFEYHVRCPYCNGYQVMRFENIKWPEDIRDPEKIESELLAWYECEHCDKQWNDYDRDLAVQNGQWRAKDDGRSLFSYLRTYKPRKIGFHIPQWLSHFVDLSEIAAAFLRCYAPGTKVLDRAKYRDFCNKRKAEPWLEIIANRDEDKIMALKDDRLRGVVPGNNRVASLFFGADVHAEGKGIYYTIKGFGYGMIHEQWLIQEGFVDSFDALAKRLWEHKYKDVYGNVYPVQFGLIDSRYRTAEVYDFCRMHRGQVLPAMGQRTKAQPFSYSNIEFYPGTKKAIPGGLQRVMIHTNHYKDALATKLEIAATDPGAYHMHSEIPDTFAAHLCAEAPDPKTGFWERIGDRPNHWLDCDALTFVAADIMDVKTWSEPEQIEETKQAGTEPARTNFKKPRRW